MSSYIQLNSVLILSKITRYEFEKMRYKFNNDEDLRQRLAERGSNIDSLLEHHKTHHDNLDKVLESFKQRHIQTKLVRRSEYETENLKSYDAIFTCGGDGTFLLAANKVHTSLIPVIGINTDPLNSEGYLCLPSKFTKNFGIALDRLIKGEFKWLKRNRISVTLTGNRNLLGLSTPTFHEFRFAEHVRELERTRSTSPLNPSASLDCASSRNGIPKTEKAKAMQNGYPSKISNGHLHDIVDDVVKDGDDVLTTYSLPDLALNEIFIGENLSSRVSYYELSIDGLEPIKQKSSGLTVCTGTGSSSWSFNINKIPVHSVAELMKIANEMTGSHVDCQDEALMSRISDAFNSKLIFPPDEIKMAYTIRDPVINNICGIDRPRGFASAVNVRSRCWDARIVIDGGYSYTFNDGALAKLTLDPSNALLTVNLT
ncbi:unnamed protein product [Gordionus sp. m RMFG-2023]